MLPTNELLLSPYIGLYDVLIPKDNVLRQINSLVDFSFVEDQLKKNYCLNNGRTAVSPIKMFKYLFLKVFYDLSDRDLVERAKFDLSFKFFLDLAPESDVIDASSLTKFRKLRIKDINILDLLIKKTVDIANENGLIKSKKLIVDSTHSCSRFNYTSPINLLTEKSKKLRKSIYKLDESYKKIMPQKPTTDNLQEHIDYCNTLIKVVKQEIGIQRDEIKNSLNLLEEIVNDNLELIESINDVDAKTGHKSIDTSFLGYKTHVGMSDERLITSAI